MRKVNIGLYRDEKLGILRNFSGPEIERKRKQIIQIFKSCGIKITVKTNLKTVDFLDLRMDLINNTHQPIQNQIEKQFTSINIQTINQIF